MLQTSANPTRRINASSGFYYAVLPSFACCPFILVRCPYLLTVRARIRAVMCARLLECVAVWVCLCCVCIKKCSTDACVWSQKLIPEGVKSLVQSRASQGRVYLVLSIYRRGTYAASCARRPMLWMAVAPPRRNTNGDADSFWFGHLSRHWSPCRLLWWWQMDCHLWMREDWDTSSHISPSGIQSVPLFCSALCTLLRLSFLTAFMSSPYFISSFLISTGVTTKRLQVKALQLPAVIKKPKSSKLIPDSYKDHIFKSNFQGTFSDKDNSSGSPHLVKEVKEASFICTVHTLSPPSVTWETKRVIKRFRVWGSSWWRHL